MTDTKPTRRPDFRTLAQRIAKREALRTVIADLNSGRVGSSHRDIMEVYEEEISKFRRPARARQARG